MLTAQWLTGASPPSPPNNPRNNRPYSRCPPSLHALRDWWDKSNVTWFLRGQTSEKNCQWKKSRLSLFILDNRKWRPFHLKDDNVKIWVEVIIVTFLYAVATVDVLMANSNDVNLAKTRYVRFARLWSRCLVLIEQTNSTAITRYWVFSHDVMATIFVSQNNEAAAMFVSQTSPLGVELSSYVNAFFCSKKFA